MPPNTLKTSLDRGLAYLATVQRPDGGFDSFSSASAIRFEKTYTYRTTFVPSLILAALGRVDTPPSRRLKQGLASFVESQKSSLGSYNYWDKNSPERSQRPYPDDLDDTCCAYIGLSLHDASTVGPSALAAIVKLLLATETRPGGPYRTWLVPPGSPAVWQDIDLAVNANVAYLLSLVSEPLPSLTACMEQAIRTRQLHSPYYVSMYPLIYYVSRTYHGPLRAELATIAHNLQEQTASRTSLQDALLLTSLLRLGSTHGSELLQQLLAAQKPAGSWPAAAFCLDPKRDGTSYYHGSESLTTAFVLEALQSYRQQPASTSTLHVSKLQKSQKTFSTQVQAIIRHDCSQLKPELHSTTLEFLERVLQSDSGPDIVNLPLRFSQSLAQPLAPAFQPLLNRLGAANLYGWAGYTIYDDFLDEEGEPVLLPVALTALRYSLAAFEQALPTDREFRRLVRQTFDIIDGANAWEISHCRFPRAGRYIVVGSLPDYGEVTDLANRSLGHSLTPLAVLKAGGFGLQTKLSRGVQQAMIHYLTARQLNDDAHDWQTDLQNGQVTYVVARLLAEAGIKPGRYALNALLRRLQRQFWHQTLPDVCQVMQQQTALGRRNLRGLSGLQSQNVITELLDDIDASLAETLAAQSRAEVFLKQYKRKQPAAI